jgi:vacuolar-type H+-ATPase subunit H
MREVIQGLLEAEAEARSIVRSARAEADRKVAEAGKGARDRVAQERLQTRAEAARIVEAAIEAAGRLRNERLNRATEEISRQISMDADKAERLAMAVVACISGQTRGR